MNPQGFATGHVRAPNKSHLIALSARRNGRRLQAMLAVAPPPTWDSRALGWVPPIKDQSQCGSCFLPGTLVALDGGGSKCIEEFVGGEMVETHLGRARKVVRPTSREYGGGVYQVRVRDSYAPPANATADHRFLAPNGDWVALDELAATPTPGVVHRGRSVEVELSREERPNVRVHCLEVEEDHSFVADGFAVHNCWDFSGMAVVEVAYCKAGIFPADGSMALSEEYILSCGRNGGCNGDDNTNVLEWAKKTGVPLTKDYGPYTARAGQCNFKTAMTLYKIDDWGFADGSGGDGVTSVDAIKAAIMEYGCVGCAVDAGFSDPGSGVISGGGRNIDHDVALVGWDDSKGHKGAWIMRNSWSTGWGNGGYAWIEYGSYSIGTEAVFAVVKGSGNIDYFV